MLDRFLLTMMKRYQNNYEGWRKEALERGYTTEQVDAFVEELFGKVLFLRVA